MHLIVGTKWVGCLFITATTPLHCYWVPLFEGLAKILDSWEESDFLGCPFAFLFYYMKFLLVTGIVSTQVKWRELLDKLCRQFRLTSFPMKSKYYCTLSCQKITSITKGYFLACFCHHDLSEWKTLSFQETDLPKCHLPAERLPTPTMTNIWLYNLAYDRPLALNFGSFFLIWVPEMQGHDFFIFVPKAWPHNRSSGYLWSTERMDSSFWWITEYFNPIRYQEENMDPLSLLATKVQPHELLPVAITPWAQAWVDRPDHFLDAGSR